MDVVRQQVFSAAGLPVVVTLDHGSDRPRLTLDVKTGADCVLHWGLSRRPGAAWRCPPRTWWPEGTIDINGRAVRTPFQKVESQEAHLTLPLDRPAGRSGLAFVLYLPRENRWLKNGATDFFVELPQEGVGPVLPEEALAQWAPAAAAGSRVFDLGNGDRLAAGVQLTAEGIQIRMAGDAEGLLLLHWGIAAKFRHEWQLPPPALRGPGTTVVDGQAARSPFRERAGLQWLELDFPRPRDRQGLCGLQFVLFQPETGTWLKEAGREMFLPLLDGEVDSRVGEPPLRELADQIIAAEVGKPSWTLMHRFLLCHDLLPQAEGCPTALALLFGWLRYSALRQLDWQRCYNTKPRELSHAQDRLTQRLAKLWRCHPAGSPERWWGRQMLTNLGRGGDGQRVRDEILHIMHRHGLKETAGNFIEEWHQKLHNNTTPDDVIICEAYLAFLHSNGNRDVFYRTLEQRGIPRTRLQSYERPIRSDPVFEADRKEALLCDFGNYLQVLKSVHTGADLEIAAGAAWGRLDRSTQEKLDWLFSLRRGNAPATDLARITCQTREALGQLLSRVQDDAALRDQLFLDLALEEALRTAIERQDLAGLGRDQLLELVRTAVTNAALSLPSEELSCCVRHWSALLSRPGSHREWALHAHAVAERTSRWVQTFSDELATCLQPRAAFLGEAFGVESWVVPLFSEEVIRGGPVFALSRLLRQLDPILRAAAGLGGWQVISSASVTGRVRVVDNLRAVQAEHFTEPTVLVAAQVSGEEEIPEGVKAVLTTARLDLVSHVAVRARNTRVLFATCFDGSTYDRLKEMDDRTLLVRATGAGKVEWRETTLCPEESRSEQAFRARAASPNPRTDFPGWVVSAEEFRPGLVGGKSNNLNGLRGRLPVWIHLPRSIALPFGTFEKTLAEKQNRGVREQFQELLPAAETDPLAVLPRVRSLLLLLLPPEELKGCLLKTWQEAGLPPIPWEQTWLSILRVWASQWNDRAYLSRRARGSAHDDLRMAVLIQQVVEADYAFVLHTVNPLTSNRDELYGEVVLGLGETLVGSYAGRALGFICRKRDLSLEIVSYPSKSVGLYGKGVICRSDSNGEDLDGFAGAGLYDSVLAEEPQRRTLDYTHERLVWDRAFREDLLRSLARLGQEVEQTLGSPQDIEGAIQGGGYTIVQARPQVGLS